jgi:hypothetical protein
MKKTDGGTSRFNVSDALDVPLRGFLLRLRRTEGEPVASDIAPGSQLRLTSPEGTTRTVTILGKSLTGGRNTQERLDRTGQLDVLISSEEAYADGMAVGIGWTAEGPLRGEDGRPVRGTVPARRHVPRPRPRRDSATGGWPFNTPGGH